MAAFDAYGIRYLVVGGIAVGFHAEPRYTKDLDLLLSIQAPDHLRVYDCLAEFGAPVSVLTADDLLQNDFVFHFGSPPWRIDILTSIPGVDFEAAYTERDYLSLGDFQATCISRPWLIKAKRASGRPQDQIDLGMLEG